MDQEMVSRVNLLVGIDKKSYNDVRTGITRLFKDKQELGLDTGSIAKFASQFKGMIADVGSDLNAAASEALDKSVGKMLKEFGDLREDMVKAAAAGDSAAFELLREQEDALSNRIAAETQMVQDRIKAERQSRAEAKKAEEDAAESRTKSAKELRDSLRITPEKFKDGAEAMGSGFLDVINKAKAGDLAGLGEGLGKAMASGLGKASKTAELGGKAAGSAGEAKAMAAVASGLSAAAVAVAAVVAAVAAVVAVLVMADQQAKDLNKTMLEGASMSDMAFKGVGESVGDVTKTMDAARSAAIKMSTQFRGTPDEFAGIISQLNQAGLSYGEMTKMAGRHRTETEAIAKTTEKAFVWSQALGISTSETADAMATWSSEFGAELPKIGEQFASIAKYAGEGGFNVKRFFSSVSQATAGMQLYNVRVEEAAYLLSKTSKILGDTDASDFIKSLTQGFTDESMVDRMKRVMIAGGEDTKRIFSDTADRTAKGFVDTFKTTVTGDNLKAAFEDTGVTFDHNILSDPATLKKTWGEIDDKSRRLIIARLRENGDEQSSAMARQLTTMGKVLDGADGGFSDQVKGLSALDMQGKLAFKMQTLGDKRLNEMGAVELAAFESYAGISGSQLEQLMRVEDQLFAEYELAVADKKTTAKSFEEWVSSNEDAQKQMDEVKDIEDEAKYYARQNVENTRSSLAWMQNTLASILNDIYQVLSWDFLWSKKLSQESIDKQTAAVSAIQSQKEAATKSLEALDQSLATVDKTLATTGKDSQAHQDALAEKARLESEQRQKTAAVDLLDAQERAVLSMDEGTVNDFSTGAELISEAARSMSESKEDLDIIGDVLTKEEMDEVLKARGEAAMADPTFKGYRDMATVAGKGDTLGWGGVASATLGASAVSEFVGASDGPMGAAAGTLDSQQIAKGNATLSTLLGGSSGAGTPAVSDADLLTSEQVDLGETSLETQDEIAGTADETLKRKKKEMQDDKKWRDSTYAKKTEEGSLDALKTYDAWKAASAANLTGSDLEAAIESYKSGASFQEGNRFHDTFKNIGTGGGGGGGGTGTDTPLLDEPPTSPAEDFVMRPGQPAQRFSSSDTLVGFKPGGPIAGAGGGGTVNITINGGDQSKVYQTVKDALKNSGLR